MKNGFTLVELLAVIVILAVLALIATPVVLSIIDDAKESAMLRSAEMYLSGVENAVMRENMNSGGNFRPSECTITNGNMTCGSTNVEVEVDGEVPTTGSIVFENGKIISVTLNYVSGTIIKDASGNLVYEGSVIEKVDLNPKKETYTIGEEVTIGEEKFYVIGDDDEKVTLLAKDCIDTTNLVQSSSVEKVVFSNTNYWSTIEGITYPYDLNNVPTSADTDAISKARVYGTNLGGTGRLMTYDEAQVLKTVNSDILFGKNGKSSSESLNYWLSTAEDNEKVWACIGGFMDGSFSSYEPTYNNPYMDVRPVVEISKSKL